MSGQLPSTVYPSVGDLFINYVFVASGGMTPEMGVAVGFKGRVDEWALRRAVVALLETEPVLGYRFVTDAPGPLWERADLPEAGAVLPVAESDDLRTDLHEFLALPLDTSSGPQLRALLLRSADRDVLALQVSHLAVDGRGAVEALYRLCEIHQALVENPEWEAEFNVDSIRDFAAAGVASTLGEKVGSLRATANMVKPSDWPFPDSGKRGKEPFVARSIEPATFDRIQKKARGRGATVNDVLLAAYYQSLRRALRPPAGARTPISIGADLRKYLETPDVGLSNFAAMLALPFVNTGDDDFDSALAIVQGQTRTVKDRTLRELAVSRVMGDRMMGGRRARLWRRSLERMGATMMKAIEQGPAGSSPVLTNIGEIDSQKVRFGGPTVVDHVQWFVQQGRGGGFALGVSSYRGRLDLCLSVDPDTIDADLPAAIVDGTVRELLDWAAASEVTTEASAV